MCGLASAGWSMVFVALSGILQIWISVVVLMFIV
jgi:hypothetical protein